MTIKEIDLLFRGMTPNLTIIGRWGSIKLKQENDKWDIEDILDVPISRYRFIRDVDITIDQSGRESEKTTNTIMVYLDDSKLNLSFYKKIQNKNSKEMREYLAAQTAE